MLQSLPVEYKDFEAFYKYFFRAMDQISFGQTFVLLAQATIPVNCFEYYPQYQKAPTA
jgi:hypothetical protein